MQKLVTDENCTANTRHAVSCKPNLQQQPKGQMARFREVMVPHKRNAVIVSMAPTSEDVLDDRKPEPNP